MIVAGFLVFAGTWLAARAALIGAYSAIDLLRTPFLLLLLALVPVDAIRSSSWWTTTRRPCRELTLDLVLGAVTLAICTAILLVLRAPALAILVLLVASVACWVTNRPCWQLISRSLGLNQDRALVVAVEAERGRLAHEIHDEPLQVLSGVIQRLEGDERATSEARRLQLVASQLRRIATDLRPPVLIDLGLSAALSAMIDQANANPTPVRVSEVIDDATGIAPHQRLPPDVEHALYRIASEAVSNAQRHGCGSQVEVRGALAPHAARLIIEDDGAGIDTGRVKHALRLGRLGLIGMRERAAAIGGEISVTQRSGGGTRVEVQWSGRR